MIITRPALSAAFGLLLALSLSLKIPHLTGKLGAEPNVDLNQIASVLDRHGYTANQFAPPDDMAWVVGTSGSCAIRVSEVSPQGWHQSLVAKIAADDQLFYTFAGQVYREQPIFKTRVHYYWSKLGRNLGFDMPKHPVLAVIVMPSCDDAPLMELAGIANR
ncbi:hypothetical protein [Microvirga puerhi]|uniref:Uncharacterized protein n=1 Tax=Microvirga puerhi TaxID=2876078 RepID=A0ABS7VK20_9HYPH|nr:hypothetical protein [Microvirga puerhi]MBZ6075876.1 hypothetical protein [Microvirga puerhi]